MGNSLPVITQLVNFLAAKKVIRPGFHHYFGRAYLLNK
jgi:hypothetical protein